MAKINLDIDSNRSFGKYLPSVLINAITVDKRGFEEGAALVGEERVDDIVITANLTINITKPKTMNNPREWILENLGDLYLYGFINNFTRLNDDLDNKNLKLKELFDVSNVPNRETFSSSTPGSTILLDFMKTVFINKSHNAWLESGSVKSAYDSATRDELAAGVEDPACLWHYVFYGSHGTTGPWYGASGDNWADTQDMASSKTLYADTNHVVENTYNFEDEDIDRSFLKKYLDSYMYSFIGADAGLQSYQTVTNLKQKLKLSDLLADPDSESELNEYGANFFVQNVYDSQGNEMIQVSNIKLSFVIGMLDPIESTPFNFNAYNFQLQDKVYFITTIGIDTDILEGEGFEADLDGTIEDRSLSSSEKTPVSIFNNFFGNISYEHILEKGEVPDQILETYVEVDTEAPYDNIPIANFDGRFHASEPVDHDAIIGAMNSLITAHLPRTNDSKLLKRNINDLQLILETYDSDIMLLRRLLEYQLSYTPKDPSKPTGWFFNEYTAALETLSKRVGFQKRLEKRLSRVGIVTDYREVAQLSGYIVPNPGFDGEVNLFPRGTESVPSQVFIPPKWSRLSRQSVLSTVDGSDTNVMGLGSDYMEMYNVIWDDILASGKLNGWKDMGFTEQDIRNWVSATVDEIVTREGGEWTEIDGISAQIDDMHDPYGVASLGKYDECVRNMGTFWFDWEKALYTQSKLAHVLRLNKLGRWFRLRVPYQYFPMTYCRIIRTELDVNTALEDYESEEQLLQKTHTIEMKTNFSDGEAAPGLGGQTCTTEFGPYETNADYAYFMPVRQIMSLRDINYEDNKGDVYEGVSSPSLSTVEHVSYLKFINSDVSVPTNMPLQAEGGTAGSDEYILGVSTLSGYGYAPPGDKDDAGGYTVLPIDQAAEKGWKVRNGYRLMCFEFQDLMDDDVAYYNTIPVNMKTRAEIDSTSNRMAALEQINTSDEPNTEYLINIQVMDKTLSFYTDVFYPFLEDMYAEFLEYYEFAEEFCSFNNLNNQFNTFFVEAINKKYADEGNKMWVKAALIATLLKETLFSSNEILSTSEAATAAAIESEVLSIVDKISPETGNLKALREFNCRLQRYLLMVNPNGAWWREFCDGTSETAVYDRALEMAGVEPTDDTSGWETIREATDTYDFWGSMQIDKPIYGDFTLNPALASKASFGLTSGGDFHPLSIPPMHIYVTAGRKATNVMRQCRIMVRTVGRDEGVVYAGSTVDTYEEGPVWRFIEEFMGAPTDLAEMTTEATGMELPLPSKITTPILFDLSRPSAEMFMGGSNHRFGMAEHQALIGEDPTNPGARFVFCVVPDEILTTWKYVPGADGTSPLGTSVDETRFAHLSLIDPTTKEEYWIHEEVETWLDTHSAQIPLQDLFTGIEWGISDTSAGLPTSVGDSVLPGYGGAYADASSYIEFPNWANFDDDPSSPFRNHMVVRDWRNWEEMPDWSESVMASAAPTGMTDASSVPTGGGSSS